MLSFLLQIVAAVNANGQHDNGVFIAFNYVVPLGVLFAGLVFSKWCAHFTCQFVPEVSALPVLCYSQSST